MFTLKFYSKDGTLQINSYESIEVHHDFDHLYAPLNDEEVKPICLIVGNARNPEDSIQWYMRSGDRAYIVNEAGRTIETCDFTEGHG